MCWSQSTKQFYGIYADAGITTWMADYLWIGKPSQYLTNHQGQLSLPSLLGR